MPQTDDFDRCKTGLESPIPNVITGWSLDQPLPKITRMFRVSADGDLVVVMLDQNNNEVNHTIPALKAGEWFAFRIRKVLSSGTTIPLATTNIQLYY